MAVIVDILRSKPIRYWVEAVALILIGVWVGHYISAHNMWLETRYSLYSLMQETNWRKPYVQHTFVVTVDDDDYWKGDFNRRTPIRRDLLAQLISRLADAQAKVIAVDFDLRSPVPDGNPRETPVYQHETDELLEAITKASSGHHAVVLPATIGYGPSRLLVLQSSVYSGANLPLSFFSTGHIALPDDARLVPLELPLAGHDPIDSFALAAVRAYRTDAVRRIKELNIYPFGGYLKPEEFPQLTASRVLSLEQTSLQDKVAGQLVFIGSNWHRLGWKTGPLNDSHATPVGPISGVFVHANYAEAILGGNYYQPPPELFAYALEILVLLAMAVLFAVKMNAWKKLAIVVSASLLFIVVGYVLLQNLGIYFDFLIPLVFLLIHVSTDRILEWRRIALACEERNG
ncbi:MAG: CHASE2 domain-containing protein [Terracidiphilus sp.]|jgi:CHASE2 domain-containing sensor protein